MQNQRVREPKARTERTAPPNYRTWAGFDPYSENIGCAIRVARRPSSLVAPPRVNQRKDAAVMLHAARPKAMGGSPGRHDAASAQSLIATAKLARRAPAQPPPPPPPDVNSTFRAMCEAADERLHVTCTHVTSPSNSLISLLPLGEGEDVSALEGDAAEMPWHLGDAAEMRWHLGDAAEMPPAGVPLAAVSPFPMPPPVPPFQSNPLLDAAMPRQPEAAPQPLPLTFPAAAMANATARASSSASSRGPSAGDRAELAASAPSLLQLEELDTLLQEHQLQLRRRVEQLRNEKQRQHSDWYQSIEPLIPTPERPKRSTGRPPAAALEPPPGIGSPLHSICGSPSQPPSLPTSSRETAPNMEWMAPDPNMEWMAPDPAGSLTPPRFKCGHFEEPRGAHYGAQYAGPPQPARSASLAPSAVVAANGGATSPKRSSLDSLAELEALLEEQHNQLIARGFIAPEHSWRATTAP